MFVAIGLAAALAMTSVGASATAGSYQVITIMASLVPAQADAPGSSFDRYTASLERNRDCVIAAAARLEVSGAGAGDIADTALLQCREAQAAVDAATRAWRPDLAEQMIERSRASDTLRRVAIATVVELRTRRAEQVTATE
jgi:hypothetical protein